MSTIIYVGALPKEGQPPIGGGEQGNQRTVRILASSLYTLKVIRKPRMGLNVPSVIRIISYPIRTLYLLIKLVYTLIQNNSNKTIVHWVGFYGTHIVVVDNIALSIIKAMGFNVVYEIRGAGIIDYNNDTSSVRRIRFERVIRKADYIFSQGLDNKPLVEKVSDNKEFFYYPNFIEDDFLPEKVEQREQGRYNLIYFGRIEEGKNILLLIDTIDKLMKRYNDVFFTLVGNGEPDYIKKVQLGLAKLPQDRITFLSGLKHQDLIEVLKKQHFFIFPTAREGHSNALTEAMGLGVVPIVSDRGFNKSVLSIDELVTSELTVDAFEARISNIIDNDMWNYYSERVHNRVKENYTYSQVASRLLEEYSRLFDYNNGKA